MSQRVFADCSASIAEFRANPARVVREAEGPVVILSRNKPTFYCVPAEDYEVMMRRLENFELADIARARLSDGKTVDGRV
ncbi:MAG: type II toxin-antitoxin system Phd/YefM family antitoxin [Parvibaculum sp.]|uniref:type II toxin-antitoxin system Phd/YefM family antitoxin n=1 Tax=Parvibaculum sp. TaxID=2024848 RepID=UPI0034A051D0